MIAGNMNSPWLSSKGTSKVDKAGEGEGFSSLNRRVELPRVL